MVLAMGMRLTACFMAVHAMQCVAASATGTVGQYRLDIRPDQQSVCIQLDPPIQGKAWACLVGRNTTSVQTRDGLVSVEPCSHIGEVIQDAYLARSVCTIFWDFVDAAGNLIINAVECRR